MRYVEDHRRQTHNRIVENASYGLRLKGANGLSVVDLMKLAGLTHGGFYNHFDSRAALVGEAIAFAMDQMTERWKKLANGKAKKSLTKEGSSQVAKTWVQSHRNPITCDGASHTQVFTLDKVEPGSKGRLKAKGKHNAGKAYIQFCITLPGATEEDTELTLSESGFVSVR